MQGLIDQIYICTPVQISTGTCNEMLGPSRAGGQANLFDYSGNFRGRLGSGTKRSRTEELRIALKIKVFSGGIGPHPDCSFAFKFPINQSKFYRFPTVAGYTLFNMYLNSFAFKFPTNQSIFYRFPTVAGNTLFNMYINFIYILI